MSFKFVNVFDLVTIDLLSARRDIFWVELLPYRYMLFIFALKYLQEAHDMMRLFLLCFRAALLQKHLAEKKELKATVKESEVEQLNFEIATTCHARVSLPW